MFESASVVICTYNRWALLADTLRTLAQSLRDFRKAVEVLVVNNGSTDNTDHVVRSFIRETSPLSIRLIHEDRKGLSFARNTGLERARGDVICFLDDDVFVPEGWLDGLLAPFKLHHAVGCVSGQIRLHYPDVPRPSWFDSKYNGMLSECQRGNAPRVLREGEDFIGANFALTKKAVSAVGSFNTVLGRCEYRLLCGEDTEYAERLWRSGFKIAYSPAGYIYHRVQPERLTYAWVAKRCFWSGATNSIKRNWLYPVSCVPRLLTSCLLALLGLFIFNKKRYVLSSFRILHAFGGFYGWYLKALQNVR